MMYRKHRARKRLQTICTGSLYPIDVSWISIPNVWSLPIVSRLTRPRTLDARVTVTPSDNIRAPSDGDCRMATQDGSTLVTNGDCGRGKNRPLCEVKMISAKDSPSLVSCFLSTVLQSSLSTKWVAPNAAPNATCQTRRAPERRTYSDSRIGQITECSPLLRELKEDGPS